MATGTTAFRRRTPPPGWCWPRGSLAAESRWASLGPRGHSLLQVRTAPRLAERGHHVLVERSPLESVEADLVAPHRQRREVSQALGPGRRGSRRVGGGQPVDESDPVGRLTVVLLGGEEHGPGRRVAGGQGQTLHGPMV